MNRLFKKISVAFAGLAMAVGVGIAVGSANRNAIMTEAADRLAVQATFDSTDTTASISDYTSTWSTTHDGTTWTLENFSNNNNGWEGYVKCGRKNNASVASIYTAASVGQRISKAKITIDALTVSKINSITLYSGTASNNISTVLGTFTKATGTQTVTIGSPAADRFYKIVVDCASGSGNGLLTLSNVSLFEEVNGSIDSVEISGTTTVNSGYLGFVTSQLTANVTTTGGLDETVTWSSSDESVAKVDGSGTVRFLANGSADITATSVVDNTKSDTVTVTSSGLVEYDALTDAGDFTDVSTWGDQNITNFSGTLTNISFGDGGSTGTKLAYNSAGQMRIYSGTKLLLTCSPAYSIEYVVITFDPSHLASAPLSTEDGTCCLHGTQLLVIVSGNDVQSLLLSYSGSTAYITGISVYYRNTGVVSVVIQNKDMVLERGDSGSFTASVDNATNPVLTWSSSNSTVLSVNSSTGAYIVGFVGTTTITASLSCSEGNFEDSFDLVIGGTVSIPEALAICSALEINETTSYKVRVTGYIVDMSANNSFTVSDRKVDGDGNTLMIFGIYSNNSLRNYAVLNGQLSYTGNLTNYRKEEGDPSTYELKTLSNLAYTDDAIEFATNANTLLDEPCVSGVDAVSSEDWEELASRWDNVDSYSQTKLQNATGEYEHNAQIAKWITRYTLIATHRVDLENFMSLSISHAGSIGIGLSTSSASSALIATLISLVSVASIGGLVFLTRKRKER